MSESLRLLETVTGVVLAGGRSTRMGTDKAWIEFDGRPLITGVVEVLQQVFARNLIIAPDPACFARFGLRVWPDDRPGLGPLGGLQAALGHVQTESLFLVGCDMPFLDAGLIRAVTEDPEAGEADAVVPESPRGWEPLHARYRRRILPMVEARIADGDYSLHHLLDRLTVRRIPAAELRRHPAWPRAFRNVNTPADLEVVTGQQTPCRPSPAGRSPRE